MEDIRYEAPKTVKAAVALLANEPGLAKVLAGGTDLLVQMRAETVNPQLLVDIKKIRETHALKRLPDGGWRIGASVTGAEMEEHKRLKKDWPGLVEATDLIGSTQIQGRCTPVGNLCNASPAADSVPAQIAAGAIAVIVGPNGTREIPAENVAVAPGRTSLAKGELVVALLLPPRPKHSSDAYLRFIPRSEMDIAVVGCGVSLTLDVDGTCTAARVALGAVGPRAILVGDAAKALIGTKLEPAALEAAAAASSAAAMPIDDKRGTKEFRIKIAGVLTRRTAEIAYERARKN